MNTTKRLAQLNAIDGNEIATLNEYSLMYGLNFEGMSDKAFNAFRRLVSVELIDCDSIDLDEVA